MSMKLRILPVACVAVAMGFCSRANAVSPRFKNMDTVLNEPIQIPKDFLSPGGVPQDNSLKAAVKLLAEMAELDVVAMDNALFVTWTASNAHMRETPPMGCTPRRGAETKSIFGAGLEPGS